MRPSRCSLLISLLLCSAARADLPLAVENLLTEKGQLRADVGVTYANLERQHLVAGEPITVQTGPATFVTLPTRVGEQLINSDTTVLTAGLRYGVSQSFEVYTRISATATRQRGSFQGAPSNYSDSGVVDAWAGVNVQIKADTETPAVLGFAELALHEQQRRNAVAFRSVLFGLTTYKAIDPVVLSLTSAYRINRTRTDGGTDFKPGNLLLVNPGVAFAVNDRITLSTGFQWTRRLADRIDGLARGFNRTSTDILMGVGYGLDKGSSLNTSMKFNASGRSGAEFRVNWIHTF